LGREGRRGLGATLPVAPLAIGSEAMNSIRLLRQTAFATVILVLGGLAACTTSMLEPEMVEGPAESYKTVAVGDITVLEPRWDYLVPLFRHALVQRLSEDEEVQIVLDPAPEQLPGATVLVSGTITEVDRGDAALRALIGFGAGRAKVRGVFEIHNDQGTQLVKFESGKAYSGGMGIGGFSLVDMEDLIDKFGAETALRLIQWSKDEGLDLPEQQPEASASGG
jgi:hypothetical protein